LSGSASAYLFFLGGIMKVRARLREIAEAVQRDLARPDHSAKTFLFSSDPNHL
jgi:hypothetical protein